MGYGYSAVELIKGWQRQGIPVWAFDTEAPVQFSYGQPHTYGDYVPGALNIGFTFWESDKVPDAWPHYMNQMDEIWTACTANAEWFRDAGVEKPIRVLPLGVDRSTFRLNKREIDSDETFRFLHIGEPTPRKGGAEVYEAFCRTFTNGENVSLTLKGNPRFKIEDSRVEVMDIFIETDEMNELYNSHHAMIYPSYGEGFGLIPFQAIATGMPTAMTNWSSMTDFMQYGCPIEIEGLVEADYLPHEGMWAKPSIGSIQGWMRAFYRYPQEYFHAAFMNGSQLRWGMSWDSTAVTALEYMTDSLNKLPS